MSTDIPLRCACGTIRGAAVAASPGSGTRIVCYCHDCQAFARFLGRPDITDAHGGTDIFQMAPGRLRITAGFEALRCMRLSDRGLHRWYCGECKTPIGNTMGPRVPFVGVVHSFMDHAGDGRTRDQALGEPIGAIQPETAIGGVPPVRRASLPRLIARTVGRMATWWLTGAGAPSPFFDERGAPRSTPRVLTPDERQRLRADEASR